MTINFYRAWNSENIIIPNDWNCVGLNLFIMARDPRLKFHCISQHHSCHFMHSKSWKLVKIQFQGVSADLTNYRSICSAQWLNIKTINMQQVSVIGWFASIIHHEGGLYYLMWLFFALPDLRFSDFIEIHYVERSIK